MADCISENIITDLSKLSELHVIARNSSFTHKGKPVDVKQVGRDLGVRYVLEGSVRKAGNRVRVTGQLRISALARLLAEGGQRDQAHHDLALVYRRFTEGFETADLRDRAPAHEGPCVAPKSRRGPCAMPTAIYHASVHEPG
jgi:hypothetical protein